jgi:hypothetical protein
MFQMLDRVFFYSMFKMFGHVHGNRLGIYGDENHQQP